MSKVERSLKTLDRIAKELSDLARDRHSTSDVFTNTVQVQVYVAHLDRQRELDRRYGPGVVRLLGSFQPID